MSKRNFILGLFLIMILATITRFYRLSFPSTYYFDEVYHALTSKLIARNDPRAYEWWNSPVEPNTAVDWLHPPLAKYSQAASMLVFGENSFGWRFSSAVFGVLTIAAIAWLTQVYFRKRSITLLAAFLASCDGLLLAQSRIAMNDIHVTFFIILTITLYGLFRRQLEQKKPYLSFLLLTGISAGLAMGSKWSGIYVLLAVGIAEFIRILRTPRNWRSRLIQVTRMGILLGIVPAIIYLASYTHMFLQGKSLICLGTEVKQGQCYCSQESSTWVVVLSKLMPARKQQFEALEARGGCKRLISHFSELHHQILYYQTHLTATHPYQSRPWQWVLDLRPVWLHVDYNKASQGIIAHIYNVGNPLLFWVGLAVVILTGGLFLLHRPPFSSWQVGFLLSTYLLVWAPWEFSPRIMFFYHYAPAVPLLAVLTAYLFHHIWKTIKASHLLLSAIVIAILAVFLALYPLNTGLPMHQAYFDTIFSLFPSWK